MITPRFECSQTIQSIIVRIYCPSVRASDVEIHVDETLVSVHINPYFLRLSFSDSLIEDDSSSANYDPGSGYLTLTLTKEVAGKEFKDLDLLAKLLAPRPSVSAQPHVEVLSTEPAPEESDISSLVQGLSLEDSEISKAAQNDWQLPQEVPEPLETLETSQQKHYGFLNKYTGYFLHAGHSENEINELGADAESCAIPERRNRRLEHEDEKWDEEYYIADFVEDEMIQELIAWQRPQEDPFEFTEKEKMKMLNLPRREYLASPTETGSLYLALLSILFAYAYDSRTTQEDPTPESAWTICTLIPAFSALDPPPYNSSPHLVDAINAVMVAGYRRSLAFPLYRSFALAERCRQDVNDILSGGKRHITRALLKTKDILDHHDAYYVYSKIWVDDFCVWIQSNANDATLSQMSLALSSLKMTKSSIGWELEALEAAIARLVSSGSDGGSSDSGEE